MIIDINSRITEQHGEESQGEDVLSVLDNSKRMSKSVLVDQAKRQLEKAYSTYASKHAPENKLAIRSYTNVTGYVCPKCGSKQIGARKEDFYPHGVPEYAIRKYPQLEEYRDKPYTLRYEGDEILECEKCGTIVELKGYALECSLNAEKMISDML